MVLCVVVGCSSRSGRDEGVSFYRIPTVVTTRGSAERELTQKRRDGYLAAISRDDLTEKILPNDRICAKHFISGKPAYLYDTTNTDWLPTLNLGHVKSKGSSTAEARYMRAKRRRDSATTEAAQSLLLLTGSSEQNQEQNNQEQDNQQDNIQEKRDVAVQTTSLTSDIAVQTVLKSEDIVECESMVLKLKSSQMFTEECFSTKDYAFITFYTGLPNFYVLKVVFDFVVPPITRTHKLNNFQEFLVVMLKGALAYGDYFFPKKFEFVSLCSFICLQAVYQLSGPVCKATWNGCPSYSASYLHFTLL